MAIIEYPRALCIADTASNRLRSLTTRFGRLEPTLDDLGAAFKPGPTFDHVNVATGPQRAHPPVMFMIVTPDRSLKAPVVFVIPPMGGFGFEYHVNDNISVGLNTRFGAAIAVVPGAAPNKDLCNGSICTSAGLGRDSKSSTEVAFLTQAGFAFRL